MNAADHIVGVFVGAMFNLFLKATIFFNFGKGGHHEHPVGIFVGEESEQAPHFENPVMKNIHVGEEFFDKRKVKNAGVLAREGDRRAREILLDERIKLENIELFGGIFHGKGFKAFPLDFPGLEFPLVEGSEVFLPPAKTIDRFIG
jgi:hypothetical protein